MVGITPDLISAEFNPKSKIPDFANVCSPTILNTGGKFTPKTTRSDPDHANSDRLRIMHRKDNSIDKMDQNSLRALASVFPTFSSLPVSVGITLKTGRKTPPTYIHVTLVKQC